MIRVTKQMSNLDTRVEGRVLEEPVMLYAIMLHPGRLEMGITDV